jgi:uncharacterized lipoprotein YajG
MTMTRSHLIPAAALLVLAACGPKAESADAAATTATAENDAQRAARIALALQGAPTMTDSILSANGLTADQLEQLMYRVAQDSTLSAEYGRLTNR